VCAEEPPIRDRGLWAGYEPTLAARWKLLWQNHGTRGDSLRTSLSFTARRGLSRVRVLRLSRRTRIGKASVPGSCICRRGPYRFAGLVRYGPGVFVCVTHDFAIGPGPRPEMVTALVLRRPLRDGSSGPAQSPPRRPRASQLLVSGGLSSRTCAHAMEQHPQSNPIVGVFGLIGRLDADVDGRRCDGIRVHAAVADLWRGADTCTFPWSISNDVLDETSALTRALLEPEGMPPG